MKVSLPLAFVVLAASAQMVSAQSIVSHGVGLSHDCYMYARLGRDLRGGVDVCNQALSREVLNTNDKAATYDNRGVLLDTLGRLGEAEADFNAAIRLRPDLGDPYVNLGAMLIKKGAYPAALDKINTGIGLGVSFPHIGYYDRAVAEQMMGRFKEAYYDYKKVLDLEPGYAQAEERLKDFTVVRKPAS